MFCSILIGGVKSPSMHLNASSLIKFVIIKKGEIVTTMKPYMILQVQGFDDEQVESTAFQLRL